MDDHSGSTESIPVLNPLSGEKEYIKQIQSDVEVVDTMDEIDVNPYVLRCTKSMITCYGAILRKLVGEIHTNTAHGGVAHIKSLTYYNIVIRI